MAIKRKNSTDGVVKDTSWLSSEQTGLLLHHLVTECVREKIMVSFSVTRIGDFSITMVFGKGETEKYYCDSEETMFMTVVDITGGSGETEMYQSDGKLVSDQAEVQTAKKARKTA